MGKTIDRESVTSVKGVKEYKVDTDISLIGKRILFIGLFEDYYEIKHTYDVFRITMKGLLAKYPERFNLMYQSGVFNRRGNTLGYISKVCEGDVNISIGGGYYMSKAITAEVLKSKLRDCFDTMGLSYDILKIYAIDKKSFSSSVTKDVKVINTNTSKLSNDLEGFKNTILTLKEHLTTEEATKTALIMPFWNLLGYNVFNPLEFMPEYVADVGIKKGEKVDYAIMVDGKPQILIEAKCVGEDLSKHYSQLYRYFTVTSAKFAILTDGVVYEFYSDIEEVNKMDAEPFITIDLLNLSSEDIVLLNYFRKINFNTEAIGEYVLSCKYNDSIKDRIVRLLDNPSDDLVRVLSGDENADKFRPIVESILKGYKLK